MSQKIAVGYYPSWWTAAPQPAQLNLSQQDGAHQMTLALLLALWVVLIFVVLAFMGGAQALNGDDLPGPRSAEPTAEDIEWAKQVFAEHDRAVAARTRQDGTGATIAGPGLSAHPPGPKTPTGPISR